MMIMMIMTMMMWVYLQGWLCMHIPPIVHLSPPHYLLLIIIMHQHHTSASYFDIIIIHQHHTSLSYISIMLIIIKHQHHTSVSASYFNYSYVRFWVLDVNFWILEFWPSVGDHKFCWLHRHTQAGSPHIHTGYCFISLLLSIPTTIRLRTKIIFSITAIR